MRCNEAFPMFDGREIWHLPYKPKIQRWYSEEMVTRGKAINPLIGPVEDVPLKASVPAEDTDMVFKDLNKIMALTDRMAMQIMPDKIEP